MKTSKIIFITFFGIIGLFLLSLLIQTNPEKRGNKELREMNREAVSLPKFSHLIVHGDFPFTLLKGNADSIKFGYARDLQLIQPIYFLKGDTLIVDPIPNNKGYYIEVLCSRLKSITLEGARLDIQEINFSALRIDGRKSEISLNNMVSIDSAIIQLRDSSRLWCNDSKIKLLQIIMQNSNAEFNIEVIEDMKAELRDSSELSVGKVLHSDVKTDETSRYYSR
jgi:hypothetical protein